MAKLKKRFGYEQLAVLAIPYDVSVADRAYARKNSGAIGITLVTDPNNIERKRFEVRAIAHLFVIGPDGLVTMTRRGYREESIRSIVAEIRKELQW